MRIWGKAFKHFNVPLALITLAALAFASYLALPDSPLSGNAAASAPAPPYNECAAVGYDTSCQILIYITNSGATVEYDSSQGPYDGEEDTLVGVLNDGASQVSSLELNSAASGLDIFGFDGDGVCSNPNPTSGLSLSATVAAECAKNTVDTTTYGGPDSYFTNVSSDQESGNVNFIAPVAGNGGSTFFSLEEDLDGASLIGVPPDTTVTTSLSGGGKSGSNIVVPEGTAVYDAGTLSGTNAGEATGTATYDVYSDSTCSTLVDTGTAETIVTAGTVPVSSAVTLTGPGTYYWQASYSGDTSNNSSMSTCGAEIETVTNGTPPPPTTPPDVSAIIEVEASPQRDDHQVTIVSPGLQKACKGLSFETLQGGTVASPRVDQNSIRVTLDADGNADVVLNGVGCVPGDYVVVGELDSGKVSQKTNLVVDPPQVRYPRQVVGYPANEVETGNTPASGDSDVYTVFNFTSSPGYAERHATISSGQLLKHCRKGILWETNSPISPFVNSATAIATIDDDGNATFVFNGASCAAGVYLVTATVGKNKYTTSYDIDPPASTYFGPIKHLYIMASPDPVMIAGG
jgi:hypothetical protein